MVPSLFGVVRIRKGAQVKNFPSEVVQTDSIQSFIQQENLKYQLREVELLKD